ncbi:hypothetical protein Taro_002733 [Colocasia esculenta]|uniref:Uncharacterized protein n=1 Tax=Colocasia esculenta TaxID=4460 RepID=A0A843TLP8_COLES|nr:hypothetical protein [Colocasia esculenta]
MSALQATKHKLSQVTVRLLSFSQPDVQLKHRSEGVQDRWHRPRRYTQYRDKPRAQQTHVLGSHRTWGTQLERHSGIGLYYINTHTRATLTINDLACHWSSHDLHCHVKLKAWQPITTYYL